ncbi:hypothetical protein BGZ49_008948 [Haplosporangium sp. Z 27]|nr:hypothetical protein BGZ49_008948 [Haplosporangium sp. Z 27]
MPPRPARSAKKNVSYKFDELDDEIVDKSKNKKGKNSGKPRSNDGDVNQDEDDSDEYVEPPKGKEEDDYYEDADMPEDEDEDMADINEEEEEEEDEDEGGTSRSTRKRRQTFKSFSVSHEEMSNLLTPRSDAQGKSSSVGKSDMKFSAGTAPNKSAPATATQRSRNQNKGKLHKKGDMRRSEFLPQSWRYSYQAPTFDDVSHVSMQEEVLRTVVYPNIGSNVKDFLVVIEPSDMDEYLPVLATTMINTRDMDLEMGTMTAQYIKTTDKTGINDFYILNTGFSVWALDWCPLPSYEDDITKNMNYIAVGGFPDTAENCIARDQLYPLGKQDAHPNVIQLWSVNCSTDENGQLQGESKAYLAICILHSYGAVLDLKWCPTGCFMPAGSEPGDLPRLGVLAAAFTDGTIRIFCIPDPISLQSHLGLNPAVGTSSETIYIKYPEPYATIRLGDVNFMSISWGTANRLAAGATNGTAAIWDMSTMLSQSKETLAEKDSDPIFLPQIHDVCVRSIDWLRDEDPNSIPWIVATSGYDGHVRYTDLRDPFGQIDIKTILGAPMICRCVPWAEGTVYIDIDLAAKFDQLYLECRGFRLFNAKGTVWDVTYSDYQPYLAAGISDGHVKLSNPAYKARRGYGMIQNYIYQIQEASNKEETPTIDAGDKESSTQMDKAISPGLPQEDIRTDKVQMYRYDEGEEKEYSSKSDGSLNFYSPNIAIQKVQWSRSFHSAAWLASGSAGGMVRVDNTLLRKGEGGAENKIEYEVEPYILKKRLASGKSPRGRKDGLPAKIGRPRKPVEETTRGKRKLAMMAKANAAQEKSADGGSGEISSSTPEKRITRQTGKLAPIFTRTLSNAASHDSSNSANSSRAATPPIEEQGEPESQAESSNIALPSENHSTSMPGGDSQTGYTGADGATEDSRPLQNSENQIMEESRSEAEATVSSQAAGDKGKTKATAASTSTSTRGRGKSTKSSQKVTPAKGKKVQSTDEAIAEPTVSNISGDHTSTSTVEAVMQREQGKEDEEAASPSASSSRASSVAPNSPRKKRGPYKTKKHVEEIKRTNLSLKDLWGAAAANNKHPE